MPLAIVRLVLICKAMGFAYNAMEFASKIRCLTNQNKPDNGQRHRVSHHLYRPSGKPENGGYHYHSGGILGTMLLSTTISWIVTQLHRWGQK